MQYLDGTTFHSLYLGAFRLKLDGEELLCGSEFRRR
jgi:hypothetical protein